MVRLSRVLDKLKIRWKGSKEKLEKQKALNYLKNYTKRITSDGKHVEYSELQLTWNRDILERSIHWIPETTDKLIGIGSFQGALEISLSHFFNKVICVDHKSFLPKWKPKNVFFHKADLDTNDWNLPEGMFDICYIIETIEHFLWSPIPLLKWAKANSHITVISTPDDKEWPPMKIKPWTRYQHFMSIPLAFPGSTANPEPMEHCKQYSQDEFIELLTFVGFRLEEFFRTGEGHHQMVAICSPRQDQLLIKPNQKRKD